jgi:hypothetical protein
LARSIGARLKSADGVHPHGRDVEEAPELVPLSRLASCALFRSRLDRDRRGLERAVAPTALNGLERKLKAAQQAYGERLMAPFEAVQAARHWWDRALPAKKEE